MGDNNNNNGNDDDEVAQLRQQLASSQKETQQAAGTYWGCIPDVFGKELVEFGGAFDQYKGVRRNGCPVHYRRLYDIVASGEGIEAELVDLEGGSLYSVSVAEGSVVTFDTNGDPKQPAGTEGTKNHQKKHLKTIGGEKINRTNKSKAHLIPDDECCNEFWLPELELILGIGGELTVDPKDAMHDAARLHTNKLVFGMEHKHYFDTLLYGKILAIPLFSNMGDIGRWEYKQPYEMLIVCDSSATYKQVRIIGSEDHVEGASAADINDAAALLTEATRFLADSLQTNWDSFYDKAGSGTDESNKRKNLLKNMVGKLGEGQVWVPTSGWGINDDPKVYKVKYGDLFVSDEAKKYIPDPLLLLIKAAVNLSAHHYARNCKLLPACISLSSEESSVGGETSEGPINIVTAVPEIRVVSDDETSVCSDVTYDKDDYSIYFEV